ncbi:MAG: hypothetical protein JWN44_3777 [Myxococcales bacterium]|nr:hypothetical protein [Myxococcales bacterium]
MKTVSESVVLPCTPEAFWRLFLDESYMRELFMKVLEFKDFTVLELTDAGRKIRAVPKMKLPAVIDKLVGDTFAYEEHGTLDRARNQWTWRMVQPAKLDPKAKPKKEIVSTRGTIRVAPTADGQCRRTDDVTIEAHLFGVGGMIESTVEKEVRSAWTKEFAFLKQRLVP